MHGPWYSGSVYINEIKGSRAFWYMLRLPFYFEVYAWFSFCSVFIIFFHLKYPATAMMT